MISARRGAGVTTLRNKIFAIGGFDGISVYQSYLAKNYYYYQLTLDLELCIKN